MNYVSSGFNNICRDRDEVLIFNSRSKRYVKTKQYNDVIYDILAQPDCYVEHPLFTKLCDAGVLVSSDIDEEKWLEVNRNNLIYNSQLHICILPTEQCNLRCVYCYEEFQRGKMKEETQEAFIIWLKHNISKYTSVRIDWFGGEPLVAKDVIYSLSEKMIEICHHAKKPYTASITTNGTLLDTDTFRKLLKYHVTSFQVTIDGTRENHNQLKIYKNGKGSYDDILKNIIDIKEKVRSANTFRFTIRTNVTSEVAKDMVGHLKKLTDIFKDDKRFVFFFRPVGRWGDTKEKEIHNNLLHSFSSIYDPIIRAGIPLNYQIYSSLLENQMCHAAEQNYYVLRSDGEINKCTMLLSHPENNLGYLRNDGKMVIDYWKAINWIVPAEQKDGICQKCGLVPSCNSMSCPAKNHILLYSNQCGYEAKSMLYIMKLLNQSEIFEEMD